QEVAEVGGIKQVFVEYYKILLGENEPWRTNLSFDALHKGPVLLDDQRQLLAKAFTSKDVYDALKDIDADKAPARRVPASHPELLLARRHPIRPSELSTALLQPVSDWTAAYYSRFFRMNRKGEEEESNQGENGSSKSASKCGPD
ncbi:hypothetical protein Drorol1_Dr00015830, partial [Drosera rotundifolia]